MDIDRGLRKEPSILARVAQFLRYFRRSQRPRTARDERIYAIGDIHGRLDLLRGLLAAIGRDNATRDQSKQLRIIIVGDFIDRGPDSARVMQALRSYQETSTRIVVLLGNHEAAVLETLLGNEQARTEWLRNGGDALLRSFDIPALRENEDRWNFAARLGHGLGEENINWLRGLPVSVTSGDYFFCHAGVEPGVALSRQSEDALLTVRDRFMSSEVDHGAVIVHGHSRVTAVEIRHNRISLDTGGYETGILSAIGLEDMDAWPIEHRGT